MMEIFKFVCVLQVITCAFSASVPGKNDHVLYDVVSSDITFRLYTPESPTTYINLLTGQLSGVSLDISRPFKFIIHGYTDNAGKQWVIDMKDAYLKKGAYNVIAVDWSGPAMQIYDVSAANTRDVGKYVALLITDLYNTLGVSYSNIHLIGHSLGAHVSGFCGQYLLSTVSNTIARITGMDPAGPLFVGVAPDSRLSPGDALFIDIIHTDGNVLGYYDVCGDIDFYVNGGVRFQPSCLTRYSGELDAACSHIRSYIYFTESINSVGFISNTCSSYLNYLWGLCKNNPSAVMGENVDQNLKGTHHLTTNVFPPYARYGNI